MKENLCSAYLRLKGINPDAKIKYGKEMNPTWMGLMMLFLRNPYVIPVEFAAEWGKKKNLRR